MQANSQVTTHSSQYKISSLDFGLLLALVLPIFAIMPLLTYTGLPNTADGPVHLMRQVELDQAWQQGNYYPRWGTDLALGHGMPIFSYAPPLLYQLTQLFHLTGLPLDASMKAVIVLDFLLYSVGMFLFARRIFGSGLALVAAAMYVYAPYRLREAYIQGNYGQFTGLAFYPFILWSFHGLIVDGRPRYLIAAALALAGLLLSHNISFMIFAPLIEAYLLFLLISNWQSRSNVAGAATGHSPQRNSANVTASLVKPLLRTIAGGLLGLGLAAIFWLPAFGERHEIKLEGITRGFFDFRENFISLPELLSLPQPLDLTAINPEFPLSLGVPHLAGAVLGMLSVVLFIISKPASRPAANQSLEDAAAHAALAPRGSLFNASGLAHTLFFAFALFLYVFLAVPYSQSIWEAVPLLELAEFPWRMLGPALFCASFLAAPAFAMVANLLPQRIERYALAVAILAIIAFNAYYLYPSQFIPWDTPTPADAFAYEVASGAIGTTSTGEFLPRAAQQHPQPDRLWPDYQAGRPPRKLDPATLPAGAVVTIISHGAESDILQIDTPHEFVATLRTLYWPGWQLYLNDQPLAFKVTPNTGLIQATIPPGQHMLTLQLESTPLRTIGLWLSVASVMVLIIIAAVTIQNRKNEPFRSPATQPAKSSAITLKTFALIALLLMVTYVLSRPLAPFYTLKSDPNRPEPADQILQVDFGDQLRLVGMDSLPASLQIEPIGTVILPATVYWRALQDLNTNYAVFLHLDAPDGQTFATVDERHPENIPTRNWPPGLYLRNLLRLDIPGDIPPIRYDVNVGVYDPESGERLRLSPGEETTFKLGSIWVIGRPPQLTGEPLAQFGSDLTLLEIDLPAGQNPALTLYWQTGRPVNQEFSIFIHLLDKQSNLLGQLDGVPYDGLYPLSNWLPNQIITDARPLPAPTMLDQLEAIAIGIYDPTTGERLPATDAEGNLLPDNSLVIPVTP